MTKYKEVMNKLEALTESVWMHKPKDVDGTRGRKGPRNNNFTIVSYAESDMRGVVDFLHNMRVTAKQDGIDIPTLAQATANLLLFLASRYSRYYDMVEMPQVMEETAAALGEVKTPSEFLALVEAFDKYLGKVDYWYDLEIPWAELGEEFARLKGEKL